MSKKYKIKKQSEVTIMETQYFPEGKLIFDEDMMLPSCHVEGPYKCECGNCQNQFYFAELFPSVHVQIAVEDLEKMTLNRKGVI